MNDLLVTAMNGARQLMKAQSINANNLANASTDGFRGELAHILEGGGANALVSVPDFSKGALRSTGNPLDVSVDGNGWLAVVAPDGTEAYTRRGDLRVDALGLLRNGAGQQLIGENGPIALPPFSSVEIAPDGSITITPLGQGPATQAMVDRLKLSQPDAGRLERGADGLMRLPGGEAAAPDANVRLLSGNLESSNVNAVDAMVRMIDLSRQFEAHIQLMKSSQENELSLNTILSLSQ